MLGTLLVVTSVSVTIAFGAVLAKGLISLTLLLLSSTSSNTESA